MKRHLPRWIAGFAVLVVLLGHIAGCYRLLAVDERARKSRDDTIRSCIHKVERT